MACLGIWSTDAEHADERGQGEPFSYATVEFKDGTAHIRTCFTAGTLVHTKDGTKVIEDIQIGDVVLSWNEKTGEREYKEVTELFLHEVELLYEVRIQRPHDGSLTSLVDETILETTWNHPFWVEGKRAWVEARDLKSGDRVLLSDGKEVAISGIKSYNVEATKVYNFEVADNHTYFVGEDGVLVHNYDPKEQGLLFTNTHQANARPDGAKKINEGIDNVKEGIQDIAVETAQSCADGGAGSAVCAASLTPWGRVGAAIKGIPAVARTLEAFGGTRLVQGVRSFFGGGSKTTNPFKGKTPNEIDEMFKAKGFNPQGKNPVIGKGGYVNPQTNRSYYIDPGGTYKKGTELPHVDVNRLKNYNGHLDKKKFPLGDKLYE